MAYLQNSASERKAGLRFAALADDTRRAILGQLRAGPRTVGEIADELPVSRPAVSQHLRTLQEAGLVRGSWSGTRHYFTLEAASFVELRNYFDQLWQQALQAYAEHVHREEKRREPNRRKS